MSENIKFIIPIMPNLKHPFKFIICVLLTLFAHHPVADAQLVAYNNWGLGRAPYQTPLCTQGYSCFLENDMDWLGRYLGDGTVASYGEFYRLDPSISTTPIQIAQRGPSQPPSFGAGVLDALYLYDALVRAGIFTPLPVHLSIVDANSPGHHLPRFHQILAPVVASTYNHAQFVSDVLLSFNSIAPEPPASFPHGMVGALPRELQIRRAASSGDPTGLIVSGAFSAQNPRTKEYTWPLLVIASASADLTDAVLYDTAPVVRLLAGKTLKMKETASVAGSSDCTWNAKCLFLGTQNEFKLAGFSRPANVVNISMGTAIPRKKVDARLLAGDDLTHWHCGGKAFQALLDDLDETTVVLAGQNYHKIINPLGFGCKNVVSAIGYHRYTAKRTAEGDFEAIIAQSYPFTDPNRPGRPDCSPLFFWCWGDGQLPESIPHPGNYAAMPYGRIFYTDNALPYYITGNSLTAPLITGMLTLMRSIHPDFQGTSAASALQTLLRGSNKKAYVARITSESETSDKHPAELFVPIVTPVCMLLQGVIDKEITSAERIASAVGGNDFFNQLITAHGCQVAQLPH